MQPAILRITVLFSRLLAVFAVLGLTLLPPGTMSEQSTAGGLDMVLCSGTGAMSMVFDPATGETTPKPDRSSAKPVCDWAMAQANADLVATPALGNAPATATRRAAPILANAVWRPAHDPRGLYARGPPALV